jgi:hypothetical protein
LVSLVGTWEKARNAIELWEGIQLSDVSGRIHSSAPNDGERLWIQHRPGDQSNIVKREVNKENEPLVVAKRLLQKLINEGLKGQVVAGAFWHLDRKEYVFRVRPESLLGCMWWQLARSLTGEVVFGECRVCHIPLERGPDAFMSTRLFCSNKCRQKDQRNKVKSAKQLKADGRTVAQIAKHFDTTTSTITNWLNKLK